MLAKQTSVVTLESLPVGTIQPTLYALLSILGRDDLQDVRVTVSVETKLDEGQKRKALDFINYGFMFGGVS